MRNADLVIDILNVSVHPSIYPSATRLMCLICVVCNSKRFNSLIFNLCIINVHMVKTWTICFCIEHEFILILGVLNLPIVQAKMLRWLWLFLLTTISTNAHFGQRKIIDFLFSPIKRNLIKFYHWARILCKMATSSILC